MQDCNHIIKHKMKKKWIFIFITTFLDLLTQSNICHKNTYFCSRMVVGLFHLKNVQLVQNLKKQVLLKHMKTKIGVILSIKLSNFACKNQILV